MSGRYNKRANIVLGIVFCLFAAAAALKVNYPQSFSAKLAYAVFEAALVGGIADWFAVTALFRRPLGFPWHTALIPRNRAKLVEAIASGVQNELLSKESIKLRLEGARLVDLAIRWLESGENQKNIRLAAARYFQKVVAEIQPKTMAGYGQTVLRHYLKETDLADKINKLLKWGLAGGKTNKLVDIVLKGLLDVVQRREARAYICQQLESYKESVSRTWWQKLALDIAEATDTLNLAEASEVLQSEASQFLTALTDHAHPVRNWVNEHLAAAADKLAEDQVWRDTVNSWQQGLAGRLEFEEALETMAEVILNGAASPAAAAWAGFQTEKLLNTFRTDRELQEWVDERLKTALSEIIDVEHTLVSTVVKEALQKLSDKDLNAFVEDKAGEDLAWIRINGSVVGGTVGLFLFLFLYYIYGPYLKPLVTIWLF